MSKITKVSVETTDNNGKVSIRHLQESDVKTIHWKKLAESVGTVMTGTPYIP